jgi:hypothetical protein
LHTAPTGRRTARGWGRTRSQRSTGQRWLVGIDPRFETWRCTKRCWRSDCQGAYASQVNQLASDISGWDLLEWCTPTAALVGPVRLAVSKYDVRLASFETGSPIGDVGAESRGQVRVLCPTRRRV